jgi:hypothetical protein
MLAIHVPSAFIGPDTSEVDVTLTRSSPAGAAGLRKRLTVWLSDDYTPIPADPAATHTLESHPGVVNKRITFQPGQASLTIPVPVPAVPAGFGSVQDILGVSLPGMSFHHWPITTSLTVFASADKVPPAIVATRLTPQGLALTFSKPMDATTVQNVNNYVVDMFPTTTEQVHMPTPENVALHAAVYDPTTQTVTLTPAKPLDLARYYEVSSPGFGALGPSTTLTTQVLTDLEGNPIDNPVNFVLGAFSVFVGRELSTFGNFSVPGSI